MATATTGQAHRDWIASEFPKGIDAEQAMIDESKARAQAPPDPSLQVLYHEIATADERHKGIVETIATRYGHTPSRGMAGGLGETLGRLKDKVGEIGTSAIQKVGNDLAAKANAIHWYTAWIEAFQAVGDSESARELAAILTEEKAHCNALQEGLNRMVVQGAHGETAAKSSGS